MSVKNNLFALFLFTCAVSVFAQVPIFTYHAHPSINHFSAENFAMHMDFLKENHYHTIRIDELLDWMHHGRPLPFRPIMVTFDDNYQDMYRRVYPILKERGMCGVNFAHTDYVGRYGKSTWTQIIEMEREGVVFTESHSRLHMKMTDMTDAQQYDEILGSKLDIEKNIPGKICSSLAIPYGFYNDITLKQLPNAGFQAAFNGVRRDLAYRYDSIYEIPRLAGDGISLEQYKQSLRFEQLCHALPGAGWTVDNHDPNFFEINGEWNEIISDQGYGGNYSLCHSEGCVEWRSRIPVSDTYSVYIYKIKGAVLCDKVQYEISQGDSLIADGSLDMGDESNEWIKIQSLVLQAGKDLTVRMKSTEKSSLCADAVWIEPHS